MATTERERPARLFRSHVPRPRLTSLLDATSAHILLIVAPAGYGKTTLAAEWTADKRATWYHPTRASGDIAAFALELAEAASSIVPDADSRLRRRLHVGDDAPAARTLAELLAEDLKRWPDDAWLVIDDYHEVIDSPAVGEFVDWLLTLTSLRLVITSRARPPWASARRVLYGEVFEVGRDQLAMTESETESVLGDRSSDAARELARHAHGWPALIGLSALVTLAKLPEPRVDDALFRYVAEEVFERESPEVRQFMLVASIPNEVGRHPDHDLETKDALAHLLNEGLLHSVSRGTYRFHPLVREFLRQRLKTEEPKAFTNLAREAAASAREEHRWEEAVELALETNDIATAAAVVTEAARDLLDAGRIETIERWLAACASVREIDFDFVRLNVAARRGRDFDLRALAYEMTQRLGPSHARLSDAWFYVGLAEESIGDDSAALDARLRARATALNDEQSAYALRGAVLSAARLGRPMVDELVAELDVIGKRVADGRLMIAIARTYYGALYLHDLSGVWALMEPLCDDRGSDMKRLRFLRAAAYTCIARAEYALAQKLIARAFAIVADLRLEPREVAYDLAFRANAEIARRDLRGAERTLRELGDIARGERHRGFTGEHRNAYVKLQIARRELEAVVTEAELNPLVQPTAMARTEHAGLVALAAAARGDSVRARANIDGALGQGSAIEAHYYARFAQAILEARRNLDRAVKVVRQVVRDAFDADFPDAFVIAYRAYPPLLRIAARDRTLRLHLRRLTANANDRFLAAREGVLEGQPQAPSGWAGLTPREREVLALIVHGLSNAAIADRLFIAESTAKLHVHHILEKLGVRSRTQAAIAASALLEQ